MFGLSYSEMLIFFVVALLLFGKRLPEVARSVGKSMKEFKRGLAGLDEEIYTAAQRPSSTYHRPAAAELREEATAPKFEPPRFEPTEG
jgi:sec-independent protein translocase protein TatA